MGLIITLPESDFSGQGFPTLASFGQFPPSGILRLFKALTDPNKYVDSSVNAIAATVDTTAGSTPPVYSSGAIGFPDTSGASQYTRLLTGVVTPAAYTCIMLVRQKADRLMYLLRNANGLGVNAYLSAGVLGYQFNNGSNRVGTTGVNSAINTWSVLAFAVDATSVYASKNGAPFNATTFASLGGAPSAAGDTLAFGANLAAQSMYLDLGLAGIWNRVLTTDELTGVYKAIKNVCRVSKTAIVLP